MSRAKAFVAAVVLVVISGCATTQGPKRWLATGAETQTTAFGGWAELKLLSNESATGELIAAAADTLWLMRDSTVVRYAYSDVSSGRIIGWNSAASDITTITFFGMVSTISHGGLLILSAPLWMIVGAVASNDQAKLPVQSLTVTDWSQLSTWARFPQGLPDGLDLTTLRPKPR